MSDPYWPGPVFSDQDQDPVGHTVPEPPQDLYPQQCFVFVMFPDSFQKPGSSEILTIVNEVLLVAVYLLYLVSIW